jgi:hypothetical protein
MRPLLLTFCLLISGCIRNTEFPPLSNCEQPYNLNSLSETELSVLKETRNRAAKQCAATTYGCSMGLSKVKRPGKIVVIVVPVAESDASGCSYASDTQVYYQYTSSGKFIESKPGV